MTLRPLHRGTAGQQWAEKRNRKSPVRRRRGPEKSPVRGI